MNGRLNRKRYEFRVGKPKLLISFTSCCHLLDICLSDCFFKLVSIFQLITYSLSERKYRLPENAVTIRMYKEGDEYGIVKLFKEIFGREMSLNEWRWKYIESYPKKIYSSVAVHEELGIVGHYGCVCLPILHESRLTRGLAICDVMINPKFRGIRTLRDLSGIPPSEAVKDGIRLGYGFPNKDTLMRPALNLGIYENIEEVIEACKEPAFHKGPVRYGFKLFPLDYTDNRIDRLWESAADNLKLAVVRDSQYLSWRYKRNPLFDYQLWGLKKRLGEELLGLAVLKKEMRRTLIMDFFFKDNLFKPLLVKLENHIHSTGTEEVKLWIPPSMEKIFSDSGFSTAPSGISIPRTTHENTLTKDDIKGRFFYTMGDTDFL